ncbi:hypothetical protein GBA52_001497 [Prunus armeniaca]|nr:hypothetical protein GBA52_001497 [Prunus armeniaca]
MVEDPAVTGTRGFLRMRVEVNTTKPLQVGFWLPRSNNDKSWISLRYESLKRFCFRCGRLGHVDRKERPCNHPLCPVFSKVGVGYGAWVYAEKVQGPSSLFPEKPAKRSRRDTRGAVETHWRRCIEKEEGGLYELNERAIAAAATVAQHEGRSANLSLFDNSNESAQRVIEPVSSQMQLQPSIMSPKVLKVIGSDCLSNKPIFQNIDQGIIGDSLIRWPWDTPQRSFAPHSTPLPHASMSETFGQISAGADLQIRPATMGKQKADVLVTEPLEGSDRALVICPPKQQLTCEFEVGHFQAGCSKGYKSNMSETGRKQARGHGLGQSGKMIRGDGPGTTRGGSLRLVSVQIISASKNLIDTAILDDLTGVQLRCSYFYGPPYREEKDPFWRGVSNLGVDVSVPWVCVGDFNEMLWHHEKLGGAPWCNSRIRYLRNFLNDHDLIDLSHVGQTFTWARVDDGVITIQERLDRALVNTNWMEVWPNSRVVHMPRVGSDHCPLILECVPPSNRARRLFKFELAWAENPECVEIVNRGWREGRGRSLAIKWRSSLNSCRRHLIAWSKSHFPNNKKVINRLMGEIDLLQQVDPLNVEQEKKLITRLSEAWMREDSYWKQRSRILWLNDGDRNTKFFHTSTTIRRNRNRISRILGDDGTLYEKQEDVERVFNDYFSKLFASDGSQPYMEWCIGLYTPYC